MGVAVTRYIYIDILIIIITFSLYTPLVLYSSFFCSSIPTLFIFIRRMPNGYFLLREVRA